MRSFFLSFSYAKSVGAHHFHTSAKLNLGVEELFVDLTQQMIATADKEAKQARKNSRNEQQQQQPSGTGDFDVLGRRARRGSNIVITDEAAAAAGSHSSQRQQQPRHSRPGCCGGAAGDGDIVIEGLPVDNNLAASSE